MNSAPWEDRLILAAGIWLLVSPFALGTPSLSHPAAVAAYACAAILVCSSADAPAIPDLVQETVVIAVALAFMASPWLLGYATEKGLTLNAVGVGGVVAACALAALVHGRLIAQRAGQRPSA